MIANLGWRGAGGALVPSLGIGGWMPLINDDSRSDVFPRDGLMGGRCMYRNGYNNDLAVGDI